MVNKNNNKNTNIINIVNDLKGLGLLKSKRKRRRQLSEPSGKIQINPQRKLTGIERVVIDNSPMLRRDVQQIANERSLLDGKLMENNSKINFLYDQLDSGNLFDRFIQENKTKPGSLSNVQGNSLVLPSMNQLYDEDQKLKTDSINVPIVDASSAMKRPEEEQATPVKEEEEPLKEQPLTPNVNTTYDTTINESQFQTPLENKSSILDDAFILSTGKKKLFEDTPNEKPGPIMQSLSLLEDKPVEDVNPEILESSRNAKAIKKAHNEANYDRTKDRFEAFKKTEDYLKSPLTKREFHKFSESEQKAFAEGRSESILNTYFNRFPPKTDEEEILYELAKNVVKLGGPAVYSKSALKEKNGDFKVTKKFYERLIKTYDNTKADKII